MKLTDVLRESIVRDTEKKPDTRKVLKHARAIIERYSLEDRLKLSIKERLVLQYLLAYQLLINSSLEDESHLAVGALTVVTHRFSNQHWARIYLEKRSSKRSDAEAFLLSTIQSHQGMLADESLQRFVLFQNFSKEFVNMYLLADFINRPDALKHIVAQYARS